MKIYKFLALSFLLSGCFLADELPPDQTIWEYEEPRNVGLNQSQLLTIDNVIKGGDYENIEGLMIIKDSKIVFENYYEPIKRNTMIPLRRSSAMFASIAVGLLLRDGFLQSINTPISQLLPEYVDIFTADPQKNQITIANLLDQTTGLLWDEINVSSESQENFLQQMLSSNDWVRFVLEQPLDAPTGLRVTYNSGNAMVISKIVENLTQQSAESYIQEKVFRPLEIENWMWDSGRGAETNLSSGLYLNSLDIAKIGFLFLNEGIWQGREILSPNWVRLSTSAENKFSTVVNYASNWWTFSDELGFTAEFEQNDIFFFSNEIGTHLYIIPHLNMVISISASNFFYGFSNPSLVLFLTLMQTAA